VTVRDAATGAPVADAPVKLDHAGSLTGTVTDAVTGAPVPFAMVGINTQVPGVGGGGIVATADADGRYTLGGLGPYRWPIVTTGLGYAAVWSGGTADRYRATGVAVTADVATPYNPKLTRGSTLKGTVRLASGVAIEGGYVSAYNAVTGDIMGAAFVGADGVLSMPVLGPQVVKVRYVLTDANGNDLDGWFGGADRAHATPVRIPARGSTTIRITAR
jgi:hypothetical protein